MLFSDQDLIEDTFNFLEESKNLSLEFGHIWIPNLIIGAAVKLESIKEGDVFRITDELFRLGYRYSANLINEKTWLTKVSLLNEAVELSPIESEAFRFWREQQIAKSIKRYRSDSYESLRLQKKQKSK
jgi:hypothetical protein